jgi:hypothetical protein
MRIRRVRPCDRRVLQDLTLLTQGRVDQPDGDPRINAADERLWQTLQSELAALLPNSEHLVARGSGHDIQHDQRGLVVNAIQDVVAAVRHPGTFGRDRPQCCTRRKTP